jgi:hypothetical protein
MPGRLIALISIILFSSPAAAHPGHLLERVEGHDHLAIAVLFIAVAVAVVMIVASAVARSR